MTGGWSGKQAANGTQLGAETQVLRLAERAKDVLRLAQPQRERSKLLGLRCQPAPSMAGTCSPRTGSPSGG